MRESRRFAERTKVLNTDEAIKKYFLVYEGSDTEMKAKQWKIDENNIPPRITAGGCPILASFFLFLYFQKCFIKRLEYFVQLHSLAGIFVLQLSIETLFVICLCEIYVQISNEICRNFGIGCVTMLED